MSTHVFLGRLHCECDVIHAKRNERHAHTRLAWHRAEKFSTTTTTANVTAIISFIILEAHKQTNAKQLCAWLILQINFI